MSMRPFQRWHSGLHILSGIFGLTESATRLEARDAGSEDTQVGIRITTELASVDQIGTHACQELAFVSTNAET